MTHVQPEPCFTQPRGSCVKECFLLVATVSSAPEVLRTDVLELVIFVLNLLHRFERCEHDRI